MMVISYLLLSPLFLEWTIVVEYQAENKAEVLETVRDHNYIRSTPLIIKMHKESEQKGEAIKYRRSRRVEEKRISRIVV